MGINISDMSLLFKWSQRRARENGDSSLSCVKDRDILLSVVPLPRRPSLPLDALPPMGHGSVIAPCAVAHAEAEAEVESKE